MDFETIFDMCMSYKKSLKVGEKIQVSHIIFNDTMTFVIQKVQNFNSIDWSSNTQDGPTQVIICDNLIIPAGQILTPKIRCKGLILFCSLLENNGTISMSARGASAVGNNIVLYKTKDGAQHIVPKVGALGAPGTRKTYGRVTIYGSNGYNGTGRQTGGGGAGRFISWTTTYGGIPYGGNGSSYSGGSGAATFMRWGNGYTDGWWNACAAHNGGRGGHAQCHWDTNNDVAVGGVGNPAGNSHKCSNRNASGTGGLLIIYANQFINKGSIQANGVSSVWPSSGTWKCQGSGSGGGSINIYYRTLFKRGTITVNGGTGLRNGGAGTISIDKLDSHYFLFENTTGVLTDDLPF